jgi:hypothetical protein
MNKWSKDTLTLEVQRQDKWHYNSRNKAQARKQKTIISMITTCKHNNDHKFPSCSLQELKKKHGKPQDSRVQDGHWNKPTSCNL